MKDSKRDDWNSFCKKSLLMVLALSAGWACAVGEPATIAPIRQQIVFALKTWEGAYSSRDVPVGVAHSPNRNALYLINDNGSGLHKLELAVPNAQNPHYSPDGQWLYFQSDATSRWQIYRWRPEATDRPGRSRLFFLVETRWLILGSAQA